MFIQNENTKKKTNTTKYPNPNLKEVNNTH